MDGCDFPRWAAAFLILLFEFCFLLVAFQWFFTAFSVLPGIRLAISAHLLPIFSWASTNSFSSSSFHVSFYKKSATEDGKVKEHHIQHVL